MTSFESLYGERDYGSRCVACYSATKKDAIENIEEQYDENVMKIFKVFEDNHNYVNGWLIFTKKRIIFYLDQDMNKFKEFKKIIWVVDKLSWKKINCRIKEENEVEVMSGKNVLFDSGGISGERIIKEINLHIKFGMLESSIKLFKKIRFSILFKKSFWHNPWIITIIGGIILLVLSPFIANYIKSIWGV
jgi:hypothetical protein